MSPLTAVLIALVLPQQGGAMAPDAAATCAATPAAPPAELAGWTRTVPVAAGADARTAPVLAIGTGALVSLRVAEAVHHPVAAQKPVKPGSHGGVIAFDVAQAGRYRVALGAGAWVDVVADGKALASVAHGHGPACSGVRKMVDFDLRPGRHLLQLSGSDGASLRLMIARLPG